MSRPATLYRVFAADGSLLYVGCSTACLTRIPQHGNKPWWTRAYSVTLEHFAEHDAALAAERAAIASERPEHNVDHQIDMRERKRRKRKATRLRQRAMLREIQRSYGMKVSGEDRAA